MKKDFRFFVSKFFTILGIVFSFFGIFLSIYTKEKVLYTILIFIGIQSFFGGFFILRFLKKQEKLKKWLSEFGTPVKAKVVDIRKNLGFTHNGENPFVIFAEWEDKISNTIYLFESENLWFDPTDQYKNKKVLVLIDSKNPRNYLFKVENEK
ncbi:MAG: hypothetical protein Fur0024_2720 [Patescibacteria group bacterium]